MTQKSKALDPASTLKTKRARTLYINAALDTGDIAHVIDALGVVARSRGMKKFAKEMDAMVKTINKSQGKEGVPDFEVFLGLMAALDLEFSVKPQGVVKKKAATKARTKTATKTLAKPPAKRQKEMASATA